MGLRSPVNCAKPTTSEDDTVFSSVSVMPTDRSSKNSVRSGGRFMRQDDYDVLKQNGTVSFRFSTTHHCLGAAVAPAGVEPRGSSRLAMHFLRNALRAAPCSF